MTRTILIVINLIHKVLLKSVEAVRNNFNQISHKGYLCRNKVRFFKNIRLLGKIQFHISKTSQVQIGKAFVCRGQGCGIEPGIPSLISVTNGAKLIIGDYSGMSNTSIHCQQEITIGNYVNIGGGCKIFDTNFHSTDWHDRSERKKDIGNCKTSPIHIGDYVFIGARCIICKGVTIGEHSIIAAGSVVVKDIPADEVWGGNPARFIRKIKN